MTRQEGLAVFSSPIFQRKSNLMNKAKFLLGAMIVGAVLLVSLIWNWGFCRFYVPAGHFAIVIAKEGKPLPSGQILASEGEKGIQENVLGEGRHFLNPYVYSYKIEPRQQIPAGKVGLVTSKTGKALPAGQFLANRDEKGVWRNVLGPGTYSLNPHGYDVIIIDAVTIPVGYAGVVTSLSGEQAPAGEFAQINQRGILADILQPGLYYINPKSHKVAIIEVGLNQVSLLGKQGAAVNTKSAIQTQNKAIDQLQAQALQAQKQERSDYLKKEHAGAAQENKADNSFILNQHVGFPSRDGFEIGLDMTDEFELLPENVAAIYRDYGDMPAVVEKIILPKILSISRLKGSNYGAVDFIMGDAREEFQLALSQALKDNLAEKGIKNHAALIRHVNVPLDILVPLKEASIATEQDKTNAEKQKTADKLAELNTETQLITQSAASVIQNTEKLKAEIAANTEQMTAKIEAETQRQVAEIDAKTAKLNAERDVILGKATAEATKMVEGEKAKGFTTKVKALGDPKAFNLAEFAKGLNPALNIQIRHAGQGTLWTDIQKPSLEAAATLKTAEKIEELQKKPAQ